MAPAALAMALALVAAAPAETLTVNGRDYVAACARDVRLTMDGRSGIYTLADGERRYSLVPGFDVARVNGRTVYLEGPVLFRDGELIVPTGLFARPAAARAAAGDGTIPLRKVVLDAGHGGQDCGALGPGRVREKDITLSVARRLKALLEARGVEVVMTRTGDRYVPLLDRSEMANQSGADLFLSIHCNACPDGDVSGVETFAVSWSITDLTRAQKAAAKLSPEDLLEGASRRVSRGAEQAIFSAYLGEQRRQSLDLARSIQAELAGRLAETDRGVKVKNLSVLRETYVPAALAEVGFITYPDTEDKMRSIAWRQKIAEALAAGLGRYARGESVRIERIAGTAPRPAELAGR